MRRRQLHKYLGTLGLLGLAAVGVSAFTGCNSEAEGPCINDEQYFAQNVWAPILSTKCIGCHNPQGIAAGRTDFILRSSSEAGFLSTNFEIFKNVASLEKDGKSLILLKPTKTLPHEGGQVIQEGSPEYQALEEMSNRFKEPTACEVNVNAFFDGVQMMTPTETLRTAALELAGRLPTDAETKVVEDQGLPALDAMLDQYMTEETFYVRLKEIYNDLFLTDRYLNGGDSATQLLNNNDTYDPEWYFNLAYDPSLIEYYGATSWDDLIDKLQRWSNLGVGREPLELIAHVVRNNKPFTEILTAPYFMVNPFSAKSYGAYGAEFKNDADPNEFVPATIEGFPHAGVLTSTMWLNRFPTTETNRNRHRARMVLLFFLGTDILKTAEQPLDSTKINDFNPTMNKPECTVCHARLDPMAGAFHTFDEFAQYDPADTWHTDMRPPGFGTEQVPYEQFPNSLQWLGTHVSKNPAFALSAVFNMYTGLTGQKPMLPPANSEPDFHEKFQAYLAQYYTFNRIAHDFTASNYNIKTVIKGIIKGPYFRAKNSVPLTKERELALSDFAPTRFLTPEQLHRKIWAITGYPWRPRAYEDFGGSYDFLLRTDAYRLLYGGIDSEDVLYRLFEPNGIMANVADRMANEVSCSVVSRDLWLPKEERLLFPMVDLTVEPQDANGFDVPASIDLIKQNIVHLHKRILGETVTMDDAEAKRTYDLFLATWKEGKLGMTKMDTDPGYVQSWLPYPCTVTEDYWTREQIPDEEQLRDDPNYTVRAWMSVMTYLLSDYKFLYQ